jgi:ribose-phosphate pyrophosphokinase
VSPSGKAAGFGPAIRGFESFHPSGFILFIFKGEIFVPTSNLCLISGRSNPDLSKKIADFIGVSLTDIVITDFLDGEIFVRINENVRGKDVFVIQSTSNPGYKYLLELLIIVDALKRASAERITAVIPYFGYARQDRKAEPRVPITAKLIANLLTVAGVNRVLSMDLHAAQIQGFFDIPVDHLYAVPVFLNTLRGVNPDEYVVVSPDTGGVERSRYFAKQINVNMAILDKRREKKNEAEVVHLIGNVEGKKALVIDDMIDTAGTICQAAEIIKRNGAKEVIVYSSHAVFSGNAPERLAASVIDKIYVTDTIPVSEEKKKIIGNKLEVLTVSELFGQAIERIHLNHSVSSLFVWERKV